MSEECTTAVLDTPGTLISTIEPMNLFAHLAAGGSVRIERIEDREKVTRGAARRWRDVRAGDFDFVVVELNADSVDGARFDTVYLDRDECAEVEAIDHAIAALQAAREAFLRASLTA